MLNGDAVECLQAHIGDRDLGIVGQRLEAETGKEPGGIRPTVVGGHRMLGAARPAPGAARTVADFLPCPPSDVERHEALSIAARHQRGGATFLVGAGGVGCAGLQGDVCERRSTRQRLERLAGEGERSGAARRNGRLRSCRT